MSARALWDSLLPAAMVGCARQVPVVATLDDAVGQLLADVVQQADSPALAVLRSAGVIASCELAGQTGAAVAADAVAATPCAAETLAVLPSAAAALLDWALREAPPRLAAELFLHMQRLGRRLPPLLLQTALEAGRRSIALRDSVLPVLGERGRWLAQSQPQWRFASGASDAAPAEQRWSEGSLEQRVAVLREWRLADPADARERLAKGFAELPAKERAELLTALQTSLGPADEALLDSARADRSREVRQVAMRLLLQLPGSAWSQRAAQRLATLLKTSDGWFRKTRSIEAPAAAAAAAAEADWTSDGIEVTKPKNEGLGERAWWLYQLVRQVPLGWWIQTTGLSPPLLLKWAASTEWAAALQRGWFDVLLAAPEPVFAEAVLNDWPKTIAHDARGVLALLPLDRREAWWTQQLESGRKLDLAELSQELVSANPFGSQVSAALAQQLVAGLVKNMQGNTPRDHYALRNVLPELCCVLPPATLVPLAQLSASDDQPAALSGLFRLLGMLIEIRSGFAGLAADAGR